MQNLSGSSIAKKHCHIMSLFAHVSVAGHIGHFGTTGGLNQSAGRQPPIC